ncbi:hypothetical protein LZ30DRAFT_608891 [Colletotrichum cereale]|nr:hypothetical protein LZ30DRAFT_608891 [Colletotrichum cereale]
MNHDNMASHEEELSDWQHCRRVFLEKAIEEAFFISSAVLRRGKGETLLDDFNRRTLTREQLRRYIAISDKFEDSLLRRAAHLGDVVHTTTAAWLARKPDLSGEDWGALAEDGRVAGLLSIVCAFEESLRGFVLPSRDPKLREAHKALGTGPPDWEKYYGLPVENWRENESDVVEESVDEAKRRRRGCRASNKRDGLGPSVF